MVTLGITASKVHVPDQLGGSTFCALFPCNQYQPLPFGMRHPLCSLFCHVWPISGIREQFS